MALQTVKLKVTITEEVQAGQITGITVVTADGTTQSVSAQGVIVAVGDYLIIDPSNIVSILSASDYAAALVPTTTPTSS